jgi:hypothetical protein
LITLAALSAFNAPGSIRQDLFTWRNHRPSLIDAATGRGISPDELHILSYRV